MAGTSALLTRSLRTDSRLLRTHITRLVFAAMVYYIAISVHYAGGFAAPGLFFFQQVAWLNFIMITGTGLGYLAGVITEEKEENMLGLLRLAGVNAVSFLFGKTVPRLLTIALLLSVQLPFALFAVTLGGVTIHQILAAYCSLLAYLVLVAAAAFLASVVCRRTQRASSLVLVFFLCLLLAPPLARTALVRSGTAIPAELREPLLAFFDGAIQVSAVDRIRETMQTGFAGALIGVQFISNLGLAAVLLLISWMVFERFNRGDAEDFAAPRPKTARTVARFARPRVWRNAIAWKEFNYLTGGKLGVWAKLILYGLVCLGIYYVTPIFTGAPTIDPHDFGAAVMVLMGSIFLIELGALAQRTFGQEVRDRTLASLMILPHSVGHLARSKATGCLLGTLPALAWFIGGVLLSPDRAGTALSYAVAQPLGWYAAVRYIVLLHLFAYLSLYTGWHLMPTIAVGLYLLDLFLFVLISGLGRWESVTGPALVTLLGLPAIVLLQFATAARLRSAAGE